MEFSDVIKNRYSCKKFSSEQIGKDKLDAILEAGRVAPTAKNPPLRLYRLHVSEML